MNEQSIFNEALDRGDPAARSAYLDEACAGDLALRERVEALLTSHAAAGNFLGKPAPERIAEELKRAQTDDETQGENPEENKSSEEDLSFLTPADKPDVLGRLGHYEVLEVIGRGGMGIVLRAFDDKLHRVVAIKVMATALAATSPPRKRFLREARTAAKVRHEHVVDIHAVEDQPIPYLVMEYVSGETLQQKLDRVGPLETAEVLRLGQQIARGLAAAHAQGLIHRDIKPSNILLEKGADERVKITDFGLARAADDVSLTQSGMIAGTPMYMAPEQTLGEAIDHRADLFSLGSVLYTMCSGRPPFRATTSMATLKRVAEDQPRPIREIIPEVSQWLCDIIAKLHAKKPEERFPSAKEVADLLGQCIQHPTSAPLPASIAPLSPLGSGAGGEGRSQAATSTTFADSGHASRRRRPLAIAATVLLCSVGALSLTEATGVTSLRTALLGMFQPDGIDASAPKEKGKPGSGSATTPLDFPVGEVRKNFWPSRYAYFANFSPDGKYYAATGSLQLDYPGATLRVWETASGKLAMEVIGWEFLLFTPDSKRLITTGADKMIHIWDLATQEEVARFGQHPDFIRVPSLSPDGKYLLTGCNDWKVRLWDLAEGKEIARLESDGKLGYPHFCPDGKKFLTTDADGIIRLWDLTERKEVRRWQLTDFLTGHLAFLPGGQRFVTSGLETVYFFDLAVEKETHSLRLAGKLAGMGFSPDCSRLLYTVKYDPTMRLVELPGGKELATFETVNVADDNPVGINFSPDGRFAVAACCCGVVHLWRLPDPPAAGKK